MRIFGNGHLKKVALLTLWRRDTSEVMEGLQFLKMGLLKKVTPLTLWRRDTLEVMEGLQFLKTGLLKKTTPLTLLWPLMLKVLYCLTSCEYPLQKCTPRTRICYIPAIGWAERVVLFAFFKYAIKKTL